MKNYFKLHKPLKGSCTCTVMQLHLLSYLFKMLGDEMIQVLKDSSTNVVCLRSIATEIEYQSLYNF